ncbi:MAG: glucose-1-phosphate adenylyltransferase [Treponemataceae bacterium]
MPQVLSIILGGGKGTRLFPLTKERSKPAVPFGGRHRIVDIPISNCINSGFKQIYILTQFNSASLHMHITHGYSFDSFSRGFVEILAAEQTFDHSGWYEGTADAVRKNFLHFKTQKPTHYIILSGDQLYKMDLRTFLDDHIESGAGISIATTAVNRADASGFGIMKINEKHQITAFMEKPAKDVDISDWKIPTSAKKDNSDKNFLASMGIYIFNADVMEEVLNNTATDFGKEIIPQSIESYHVKSYIYDGYWEDIGTIKNFYDANIDLTRPLPKFNFYDEENPVYTHSRNLPPSKLLNTMMNNSTASAGCIINESTINNSVIGIRSVIESGTIFEGVVDMGADYYETEEDFAVNKKKNRPNMGVGKNCKIKNAIIDKNARIGDNCSIGYSGHSYENGAHGLFYVEDDIIIIPKSATIPNNTII